MDKPQMSVDKDSESIFLIIANEAWWKEDGHCAPSGDEGTWAPSALLGHCLETPPVLLAAG